MHSHFSDGAMAPEEYVQEALRQGFEGIGFSEHSVLPFTNTFALQKGREEEYCKEISRLKGQYAGQLEIYTAMEADYIPGISENLKGLKERLNLDYVIGSVHLVKNLSGISAGSLKEKSVLTNEASSKENNGVVKENADLTNETTGLLKVQEGKDRLWFIDGPKRETYDEGIEKVFGGDIKKAIRSYWNQVNMMVDHEEFDVVGHLDKIKMHNKGRWFDETSDWYTALVDESVDLIARKGLLVEINTRGIYKGRSGTFFPGEEILRKLNRRGTGIVISSDAHHPSEMGLYFSEAIEMLKKCGYSSAWIYERTGWKELPFSL